MIKSARRCSIVGSVGSITCKNQKFLEILSLRFKFDQDGLTPLAFFEKSLLQVTKIHHKSLNSHCHRIGCGRYSLTLLNASTCDGSFNTLMGHLPLQFVLDTNDTRWWGWQGWCPLQLDKEFCKEAPLLGTKALPSFLCLLKEEVWLTRKQMPETIHYVTSLLCLREQKPTG